MKHLAALTIAISLAVSPATAQPADTDTDTDDGFSLIEEGAKLLLRGLMSEMEPGMNDFRDLMKEFGPQINGMMSQLGPRLEMMLDLVDDFGNYGNPEIMPNGDIIIRRNPDAPPLSTLPEGEIEL